MERKNIEEMESKHAPAYRVALEEARDQFNMVLNQDNLTQVLNALPYVAAILNEQRQIVFANKALLTSLNLQVMQEILGNRPGEVLHCANSKKEIGGCGTSENCRYCGAVKTILSCQRDMQPYTEECRILSQVNGTTEAFDYKVTSAPLNLGNQELIVFTLLDISEQKRKKMLEKIFFHDVINKASSLQGFIDLIKDVDDPKRTSELIEVMNEIAVELTQEILNQRDLIAAESGDLKLNPTTSNTRETVESAANQIMNHQVANDRNMKIDGDTAEVLINTDAIMLKRILLNMLKNALEASDLNETVTIGCSETKDRVNFWVHNKSFIPRPVQLQLFQRSFSTKAKDRGLGTYSMKLLGERYLKGKVNFESTEEKGTTFVLDLPKNFE